MAGPTAFIVRLAWRMNRPGLFVFVWGGLRWLLIYVHPFSFEPSVVNQPSRKER